MILKINANPEPFADGISISDILESLGADPGSTLVSLNQEIVPHDDFGATVPNHGDELDLFSFVGGG